MTLFWIIFLAVLLNALGGVVFGWLFWQYGLETAILVHFVADVVLHVIIAPSYYKRKQAQSSDKAAVYYSGFGDRFHLQPTNNNLSQLNLQKNHTAHPTKAAMRPFPVTRRLLFCQSEFLLPFLRQH